MKVGVAQTRIDALTEAQRDALAEARSVWVAAGGVLDEFWQPMLLRFLVAAEWKMDQARPHLEATARWRRESGADECRRQLLAGRRILDFPFVPENQSCIWFAPVYGQTFDGNLISYISLGSLDIPTWMRVETDAEYMQYAVAIQEHQSVCNDVMAAQGHYLTRHVMVFDCAGMGKQHLHYRGLRRLMPTMPLGDLYYPEILSCSLIVNAPWIFTKIWSIVSPWVGKETRARTMIASKEHTASLLARLVPATEVPSWVANAGGTNTSMPPSVADRLGYAQMDEARRASLLIAQPPSRGGCSCYSLQGDEEPSKTFLKLAERLALPRKTTSDAALSPAAAAAGAAEPMPAAEPVLVSMIEAHAKLASARSADAIFLAAKQIELL
jgi:hypothetical protein